MKMLRYQVSGLVGAPIGSRMVLSLDEGPGDLGDQVQVDYLKGEIELVRSDCRLLASGVISTQIRIPCARCLEPVLFPMSFEFEEAFHLSPVDIPGEAFYAVTHDGYLFLTAPLREHILLNTPLRVLCRPGCRGLCPECGHNLNEGKCECINEPDPRWTVLPSAQLFK
ncbi:MAG: DUF177 domain-containing protein [Anaerolineae bacterium]|nr:DUF177 domain-containing protein [Thermoflexus sp.]MDW8064636.1 DUF177 domain-containing protein [Anaerolineae bacterium]